MNKSTFQSFINRYYLAGACEAVAIKANSDNMSCRLIDADQTVIGEITWNATPFFSGELGVNHTGSLIKMLSAVGNDINLNVLMESKRNYAIEINEGSTKVSFMLANLEVIPAVPTMNEEPEYELSIDLTGELIDKFIKAKNALPDASNFAIYRKDGNIIVVINYSSLSTDNISFTIPSAGDNTEPICFSSDKLKEIMVANRSGAGKLSASSAGLAKVQFMDDNFNTNYWLVQLQN